jgi:phosphonate transport system ATP-binding protein
MKPSAGGAAADSRPRAELASGGPAAFALEQVTVVHGERAALREVTLAIRPGEAVALVGPSGAGKTTLLRLLHGAQRASAGAVRVDGQDLARLKPGELRRVRSRIGFVHQDLALVPNVRVAANVLAGAFGRQSFLASLRSQLLPRRAELERAAALLARVGIGEKLFQRTDSLSGGQRQRVAIARALYQEPSALLADEPVSSVDPARARDTVALLSELSRERGSTLIVSLHDVELARAFFPRLVGLRAGRVVFDAAPSELRAGDLRELYALEADGLGGT